MKFKIFGDSGNFEHVGDWDSAEEAAVKEFQNHEGEIESWIHLVDDNGEVQDSKRIIVPKM